MKGFVLFYYSTQMEQFKTKIKKKEEEEHPDR